MGRYENRLIATNSDDLYRNVMKKRGLNFMRQFRTAVLRYPTPEEIEELDEIGHIWGLGDRFYKLADEHYGDPELWWVIAHYNMKPTESHVENGETIYIPLPLEEVLELLGY